MPVFDWSRAVADWPEGEALVRAAELQVSRAQRLKTRSVTAGWARDVPAIQRAWILRDIDRLWSALLAAMMRLPLLPQIRAQLFLVWILARGNRVSIEVTRLRRIASDVDLKWRTVERAKKAQGVKAVRKAGHWYWWWP